MELAVETHGLRKTFGPLAAVDGVDIPVPRGSFYGFLGPNGAGKSTTIKFDGVLQRTPMNGAQTPRSSRGRLRSDSFKEGITP